MKAAAEALAEFDVAYEADVVSAHRMPEAMLEYGRTAADRGLAVIIAGAGGAAHLPGMLAAVTPLPVIGVPVPLKNLDGLDSLLSIVQMPAGVPVATVAIGNARNAGLLAVRVLAASDAALRDRMTQFQDELRRTAEQKGDAVRSQTGRPPGRLLTLRLPPRSRLVGIDLARCLALLGMMATHVLRETDPDGTISVLPVARRRSRVGAVRRAGRPEPGADDRSDREPVHGRERLARSAGLAVRALLVALLGLVLGGLGVRAGGDPHLLRRAVPAAACRSSACAPARCSCWPAAWLVVAPVLSHLLRPHLPGRGTRVADLRPARRSRSAAQRAAGHRLLPGAAVADLPARRDGAGAARPDASAGCRRPIAAVGAALAVLATVAVARALTRLDGVRTALVSRPADGGVARTPLLDRIGYGMFGTTPAGGCLAVAAGRRPALGDAVRPRADHRQRPARHRPLPAAGRRADARRRALRRGPLRRGRDDPHALLAARA